MFTKNIHIFIINKYILIELITCFFLIRLDINVYFNVVSILTNTIFVLLHYTFLITHELLSHRHEIIPE